MRCSHKLHHGITQRSVLILEHWFVSIASESQVATSGIIALCRNSNKLALITFSSFGMLDHIDIKVLFTGSVMHS